MTDCFTPLRTMLSGGVVLLGILAIIDRTYARRTTDRAERGRRILFAAGVVFALFASVFMQAFSQSCDRQPLCGVDWDLNCSAVNVVMFSVGRAAGVTCAAALLVAEIVRHRKMAGR